MLPHPARLATLAPSLLLALACDPAPQGDLLETPAVRAPIRIPDPIAPAPAGVSADLLQKYADRPPVDPRGVELWELTFQAKLIAVALLATAASDRLEDLRLLLTPDATWGLPDPRRFGQRPVFGDDRGEAFLAALRAAAQRFPADATHKTQPVLDGVQGVTRVGAEPYWTYWVNGNDRIYLRLVVYRGRAHIDYVGFFETVPEEPIRVADRVVPPLSAPVRRPASAAPPELVPGEVPDEAP